MLELDKLREEYPDDPALKMGGVMVMCPCERTHSSNARSRCSTSTTGT